MRVRTNCRIESRFQPVDGTAERLCQHEVLNIRTALHQIYKASKVWSIKAPYIEFRESRLALHEVYLAHHTSDWFQPVIHLLDNLSDEDEGYNSFAVVSCDLNAYAGIGSLRLASDEVFEDEPTAPRRYSLGRKPMGRQRKHE